MGSAQSATAKQRAEEPRESATAASLAANPAYLLEVRNLVTWFPVVGGILGRVVGHVKAVDDVSFEIRKGETLGLVGESGCGKTTVIRSMMRLIEPTRGQVIFDGEDITAMRREELRRVRPKMQMIFQDPYGSLNPRLTVGDIVGEAMEFHGLCRGKEHDRRVSELLDKVGLPARQVRRYPHEFSGGQRQRIGIARALAMNPKLLVCDEPVSALDVSIQSQILNLLLDLQEEFGMTYLFVAHGLHVVKHVSTRVAVMYLGKIVEVSEGEELYRNPRHPYTIALVTSIPVPDPKRRTKRAVLEGDVPSPINPPAGCRFHTRCPRAEAICGKVEPEMKEIGPDHRVACHLV